MDQRHWSNSILGLLAILSCFAMFSLVVAPCLQRSIEGSREHQCLNNMAVNLAMAHRQFATINNRFCGYVNSTGQDNKCVSWVVPLFPYFDDGDLAHAWTTQDYEWLDDKHTILSKIKHPDTYIELLLCPTNPPIDEKSSPLSFVVNGGFAGDTQPECADDDCTSVKPGTGENIANGVFHDQYGPHQQDGYNQQIARTVSLQYLEQHDGAAHTVMMSENVQLVTTWYTTTEERAPLAFVWFHTASDETQSNSAVRQINVGKLLPANGQLDFARPSSYHNKGVNMAFCDGHGKFISESIDYRVYKQLMTTASALSEDQDRVQEDESEYRP